MKLGWLDMNAALISTYVVLGPAILLLGAMTYPANTEGLLRGKFNYVKNYLWRMMKTRPLVLVASGAIFYWLFQTYSTYIVGATV